MGYQNIYVECGNCGYEFKYELQFDTPNGDVFDYWAGNDNMVECPKCEAKHEVVNAYVSVKTIYKE